MKIIGYIRVSTEDQAREGVSLEMQRDRIHKWADLNEGDVVAVYEDAGISGMDMARPGLEQALAHAGKGYALVAYSISRLARSTLGVLEIAKRLEYQGADLVSLSEKIDTTSAAGRMMFRMLAVLAEFERDQISERTRNALAKLKANGVKLGSGAPGRGGRSIKAMWARYKGLIGMRVDFCVFCGVKEGVEHHHVVPLAQGGADEPENILTVCAKHHGMLHKVRRTASIPALTVLGLQRAKANGKKLGTPNPRAGGEATRQYWLRRKKLTSASE